MDAQPQKRLTEVAKRLLHLMEVTPKESKAFIAIATAKGILIGEGRWETTSSEPQCVSLSQPQYTPAGEFVADLFYRGILSRTLQRSEYSGYPHNGGEHSLVIYLPREDLDAWLKLILKNYRTLHGCMEFASAAVTAFNKTFPDSPITLASLEEPEAV